MSVAVLCPSRERPDRFRELLEAIDATAERPVRVYLGVDCDDPTLAGYRDACGPFATVEVCGGPRRPLARWLDDLSARAVSDGHSIIGFMGDDHRPRTGGWDDLVQQRSAGGMVYGRDGLQDERLPTWCFWSADVIRALGFFCPPTLEHMYLDDFWLALARGIGRCVYVPELMVEHMHPSIGKADTDEGYVRVEALTSKDENAWRWYVADGCLHADIDRVLRAVSV